MYFSCAVLFVFDAFKLRRVKTNQTIRIWRQRTFHNSIQSLRDGKPMTDEQARERSAAIEMSIMKRRQRTGSRVSRSLEMFAMNHRVFALFVHDASYSRSPTLLLELISYLFSVAVLQVRGKRTSLANVFLQRDAN